MSAGSAQARCATHPGAADPGGVDEPLDVVIEPLGLVAHDADEVGRALVLRHGRCLDQDRRRADDGGQGRAQAMRDRAHQRLAQRLRLRAQARLADGVCDPEALEAGSRIGEQGVDARMHGGRDALAGAPHVDGEQTVFRAPGRHRPHQPARSGRRIVDRQAVFRPRAGEAIDGVTYGVGDRWFRPVPIRESRGLVRGEIDDAAARHGAQVVLRGSGDLGGLGGDGKPAGEIVKRADLGFPLPGAGGIGARGGGELARYHRDDDEHHKVDELLGIGDAEVVDRRVEEECRGPDGPDSHDESRHQA